MIHVDGERVVTDPDLVYLAMNKPRGVVSTMADEQGPHGDRRLPGAPVPQRVYHVGRLDADSEGLLLLTNDGDPRHRLTHPSFGVPKTYLCEVARPGAADPRPAAAGGRRAGGRAGQGRRLPGGRRARQVRAGRGDLHEGRKHIVRRMFDEVGHPVSRLVRTAIGPIRLGDLRPGRTRRLTTPEVASLFRDRWTD